MAYVVTSLVNGKTYIMTEVPVGVASAWGSGGDDFYALQKTASTSGICQDLSVYKFNYSKTYVYDNMKCGYFNAAEMISKLPTGNVMFFATHAHQTLVSRYEATASTVGGVTTYTCPDAAMKANFGGEEAQQIIEGRCTHMKEYNYCLLYTSPSPRD